MCKDLALRSDQKKIEHVVTLSYLHAIAPGRKTRWKVFSCLKKQTEVLSQNREYFAVEQNSHVLSIEEIFFMA